MTAAGLPRGSGAAVPALPLLALACSGGVIAGALLDGGWWLTALTAALLAATAVAFGDRRWLLLVGAVALAASGHARIDAIDASGPSALGMIEGDHVVMGFLREDPTISGSLATATVDVETVDGTRVDGRVRVRFRLDDLPPQGGDRLVIKGALEAPPSLEDFDYAAFLRDRDIERVIDFPASIEVVGRADLGWRGQLVALRERAVTRIQRALPEPAASLAAGVLVGDRAGLPESTLEDLRATGTTHLVVVSGQNIALITGLAIALLTLVLDRRQASVVALALLGPYVVLVGADPPVVRAAIMAIAIVGAGITGRRTPGWIFLAYAIAVMLGLDPRLARSVAFQLSAAATAGILLIAPVVRDACLVLAPPLASPGRAALVSMFATALGAAVAVFPVQVAAFEVIAPWTVIANILVAPLYEATLAVAAIAALLGTGGLVGDVLAQVPFAFLGLAGVIAGWPGALHAFALPEAFAVFFVLVLTLVLMLVTHWLALHPPDLQLDTGAGSRFALRAGLVVVAAGLWVAVVSPGETLATISVLDVGQGLAVLVEDHGASLLIDAGPSDGAVLGALGLQGAPRPIDAVIVTHDDLDHSGGIEPLRERDGFRTLYAETKTAPIYEGAHPIDVGDHIHVGDVVVTVLSPPLETGRALQSDNNRSLVLEIEAGGVRIMVPADIEQPAEDWLLQSGQVLASDVLVLPHHGSATSTSEAFLERVAPSVVVIPVGAANPYGHPHPDVLARIAGIETYRTDEDGTVTFRTDGESLWVATAR